MELAHRKRLLATGGGAVSVIMMMMMPCDAVGHDEDVGADDDSFNDDYQYFIFAHHRITEANTLFRNIYLTALVGLQIWIIITKYT